MSSINRQLRWLCHLSYFYILINETVLSFARTSSGRYCMDPAAEKKKNIKKVVEFAL